MTAPSYFDWASRTVTRPDTDVVEFDAVQVLEGDAAEISNRIYVSQQQRADLERALVLV